MMLDLRVDLKPGLALVVKVGDQESRDAELLKRTASFLITVSRCIDEFQQRHGSYGVPRPPTTLKELDEALARSTE